MQLVQYAKSYPVATGAVVIIGGIIFIMIVRGGGGSTSSAPSGPSDAQIAAQASLQAAQIQANAGVQAANIGAGVQLNSDNKAAEVAMRQIEAQQKIAEETIAAQSSAVNASITAQQQQTSGVLKVINSLGKKRKNRAIQSFITGQVVQPQNNGGNSAAAIIGSLGGAIGGVTNSLGSLFSDQNLKENIRYVGTDARGRNLYEFNYRGSKTKRIGHIAQDIARAEPEKVMTGKGGYQRINLLPPRPAPVSLRSF